MAFAIFVIQTKQKNIDEKYCTIVYRMFWTCKSNIRVARHLFTLHNVESKKPLIHLIMNLHAQL